MITEHGITGRKRRAAALAAPRAGRYAIETVEGRRLASEVTSGRLMEAAD